MKKIFLFLMFISTLNYAQNVIEDNDITENNVMIVKQTVAYDLKNPTEFYRLKCENPTYVQFSGGEEAFKNELGLNIKSFLNSGLYSVNGTFEVVLSISKTGNLQNIQLKPEVPNSHLLQRDVELAIRKLNLKFTPAKCGETAIDSRLRQKINFHTDAFDI